jgi:hypothetical protein
VAYDQLSAVTESAFVPRLIDNIFNSNPVFARMYRRITLLDGGLKIVQPVILSQSSAVGSYSGADVMNISPTDEINAAEFDWCQYYAGIQLTGRDDFKNAGDAAVINLIKAKIQIAEKSLRDAMGGDLYGDGTGNGGKDILGLDAAIDDGTVANVYGGLNRTTYPTWKGQVLANGGVGRELTLELLQTAFGQCCKDNERPNLLLTTQAVYNKFMSLLQPGQRFADPQTASAGFQNLLYQGRPLVVDEQIVPTTSTRHRIWLLNDKYFELYVHRERNFRWVPFQQLPNQDVIVAKILFAGQLVCNQPRLNGKLLDLNPTL